ISRCPIQAAGLLPPWRPDRDDVGDALVAHTMPSHLHGRADLQVPPRGVAAADQEAGLVRRMVRRGSPPAHHSECPGSAVDGGDGAASPGRPMIRGSCGLRRRDGERGSRGKSELKERTSGWHVSSICPPGTQSFGAKISPRNFAGLEESIRASEPDPGGAPTYVELKTR